MLVPLLMALPSEPPEGFYYEPPKNWKPPMPLPKGNQGTKDKKGYEWVKGPNHHFKGIINPKTGEPYKREWDVQLPDGNHWNVHPERGPSDIE